ncbi:MAG: response regulator [Candidatus Cloacimonetes bacterium]|nr:response regulator [Candidatus Cloacimonadota bacterium]
MDFLIRQTDYVYFLCSVVYLFIYIKRLNFKMEKRTIEWQYLNRFIIFQSAHHFFKLIKYSYFDHNVVDMLVNLSTIFAISNIILLIGSRVMPVRLYKTKVYRYLIHIFIRRKVPLKYGKFLYYSAVFAFFILLYLMKLILAIKLISVILIVFCYILLIAQIILKRRIKLGEYRRFYYFTNLFSVILLFYSWLSINLHNIKYPPVYIFFTNLAFLLISIFSFTILHVFETRRGFVRKDHKHIDFDVINIKYMPLILFIFTFLGFIFTNYNETKSDGLFKRDLLKRAESISSKIDVSYVESFNNTKEDWKNPLFQRIRNLLLLCGKLNPDQKFLYLMIKEGDKIKFSVENVMETEEIFQLPGNIYEECPDIVFDIYDSQEKVIFGPYEDQWGQYISAFIPIVNQKTQKTVAVLGMDIDISNWQSRLSSLRFGSIMLTYLIIIIMIFGLLLTRIKRHKWSYKNNLLRYSETIVIFLIAFTLSLSAFFYVHRNEKYSRFVQFKDYALIYSGMYGKSLSDFNEHLNDLIFRIESQNNFDESNFKSAVDGLHHFKESIQSVYWVPNDKKNEKYYIRDLYKTSNNNIYKNMPLNEFPILNQTINETNKTGLITASQPFSSFYSTKNWANYLIVSPFKNKNKTTTDYLAMELDLHAHIQHFNSEVKSNNYFVKCKLVDLDFKGNQLVGHINYSAEDIIFPNINNMDIYQRQLMWIEPIFFNGRTIAMVTKPSEEFYKFYKVNLPWLFLILSLVLTSLLTMLFYYLQNANQKSEDLVNIRTLELKEKQDELTILLDNIDTLIGYLKTDETIGMVNKVLADFLGYEKKDIENLAISKVLLPEILEIIREKIIEVKDTLKPVRFEIKLDNKDKQLRNLEVSLIPKMDEYNQIEFLICSANDVTERSIYESELIKAKDNAEMANKAKSQFLAMMSHEIRTPMNGIVGLTDLVLTTRLTQIQRSYLSQIQQSTFNLLNIINDILDFSKIEAGKLTLIHEPFNLRQIIQNSIRLISHKVNEKHLDLFCRISNDIPQMIISDPLRVNQILINFLSNAIKFTDKGEIIFTAILKEENLIQISVKDSGIGIPPDMQEKIFESFTQADISTTRKYGGTGLGLSIARQLSDLLKGEITFNSVVGEGSEFIFTFPFERLINDTDVRPVIDKVSKILIVDDNSTNTIILEEILKYWNIQSAVAKDAFQAISLLENENFDLILMDYMMPKMNGIDAVKTINEKFPGKSLFVIMLTSNDMDEVRLNAQEIGVRKFLTKPVLMDDLYELLNNISQHSIDIQFVEDTMPEESSYDSKVILVAEDDSINMTVITTILDDMGFKCLEAINGEEAVRLFNEYNADLILMDIHMPVMDGIEATRIIKSAKGKRIPPIIALTADILVTDTTNDYSKLFDSILSKPYRIDQIDALLSQFFNKQEVRVKPVSQPEVKKRNDLADILFDEEEFIKLIGGDKDFASELIAQYIKNSEDYLMTIEKYINEEDYKNLDEIVHKLKGLNGNVRANRLFKVTEQLNFSVKNRESKEDLLTLYEIMFIVFEETKKQMLLFLRDYITT